MNDTRELNRHLKIMKQIEDAEDKSELPNFNLRSEICTYLSNNVKYKGNKLSAIDYYDVYEAIITSGVVASPEVKKIFINTLANKFEWINSEDIINLYVKAFQCKRISYLLREAAAYNDKIYKLEQEEINDKHNQMMKDIDLSFSVKELPKVGLTELNSRLVKDVNNNDFINNIKISDIKELTNNFLYNPDKKLSDIVFDICDKYDLTNEDKGYMCEQILAELYMDSSIELIVKEIKRKEKRKLEIYKLDHDYTMTAIRDARRISQLPPNISRSSVLSYLLGNSTIYSNDNRLVSDDLKQLSSLLLKGYTFEDYEVRDEIRNITKLRYPDKEDAYELLLNKLSNLPRTYYLVDEVNYYTKKENEFISRQDSNVNVYFIENNKAPEDGGKFYNCYINRVGHLNLDEILPLDLDSIIPPKMDIDAVEWFVQEYADPTFKKAGAIILKQDETIGSINIFKPNDNKIGVTKEEKEKIDQISDLDKQILEKQELLAKLNEEIEAKQAESARLDEEIEEKKQVSFRLDEDMETIIIEYETKAMDLQNEMMNSINAFKEEVVKKRVRK